MSLEAIIVWIIFGLIAGVIAKFVMPGADGGGWVATILLGIIGAFVGGFIFNALGISGGATNSFDFMNILAAVIGAIVVLFIYRLVTRR